MEVTLPLAQHSLLVELSLFVQVFFESPYLALPFELDAIPNVMMQGLLLLNPLSLNQFFPSAHGDGFFEALDITVKIWQHLLL